jgi:hypothetical protein
MSIGKVAVNNGEGIMMIRARGIFYVMQKLDKISLAIMPWSAEDQVNCVVSMQRNRHSFIQS